MRRRRWRLREQVRNYLLWDGDCWRNDIFGGKMLWKLCWVRRKIDRREDQYGGESDKIIEWVKEGIEEKEEVVTDYLVKCINFIILFISSESPYMVYKSVCPGSNDLWFEISHDYLRSDQRLKFACVATCSLIESRWEGNQIPMEGQEDFLQWTIGTRESQNDFDNLFHYTDLMIDFGMGLIADHLSLLWHIHSSRLISFHHTILQRAIVNRN